jgi:hypothetical protein
MLYTKGKRLVITKSARHEMDYLRMTSQRLITAIEEGERKLESRRTGKWLVQHRFAGKFVLIRYAELEDKIVVINIGQTTRRVL